MTMTMTGLVLRAPVDFFLTNGLDRLSRGVCPPVMGPDLAHNRASQPQYC